MLNKVGQDINKYKCFFFKTYLKTTYYRIKHQGCTYRIFNIGNESSFRFIIVNKKGHFKIGGGVFKNFVNELVDVNNSTNFQKNLEVLVSWNKKRCSLKNVEIFVIYFWKNKNFVCKIMVELNYKLNFVMASAFLS